MGVGLIVKGFAVGGVMSVEVVWDTGTAGVGVSVKGFPAGCGESRGGMGTGSGAGCVSVNGFPEDGVVSREAVWAPGARRCVIVNAFPLFFLLSLHRRGARTRAPRQCNPARPYRNKEVRTNIIYNAAWACNRACAVHYIKSQWLKT